MYFFPTFIKRNRLPRVMEELREILLNEPLMALATSSADGEPEVAMVEFVEHEGAIYFETFKRYRKYQNLQENPRVSITVLAMPHTVQLQGVVEELSKEAALEAKNLLVKKGSHHSFYEDPDTRFFKIQPTWIRIGNHSSFPPKFRQVL